MKRALSFLFSLLLFLPSCSPSLTVPEETTELESKKTEQRNETVTETEEDFLPSPTEDDVMNVLMIGNSYCYYYVEELYGVAQAAGVEMNLYNVYASGCPVNRHWEWYLTREKKYELYRTDSHGRVRVSDRIDLISCLAMENWDVISLQEGNGSYRRAGLEGIRGEVEPATGKLLDMLKKKFPLARYCWQTSWVPQVGNYNEAYDFRIESIDDEIAWQKAKITVGQELCEKYALSQIPSGQAWSNCRYNPVIGNTLCLRLKNPEDTSHDGDVGGGQYLNACVWFEALTGRSCIGNTYRPEYELSEEKIAILQKAAHKAVAENPYP